MNTEHTIKVLLFDLDGTLVDSERFYLEEMQKVFKEKFEIILTSADFELTVGRKLHFCLMRLYERYRILERFPQIPLDSLYQELVLALNTLAEKPKIQFIPGAIEAIKKYAKLYDCAIVSGANRNVITNILQRGGVLEYFKNIWGAEDYQESKPSPQGYLKALEYFNVQPHQAVVFEDSEAGIASGKASQCYVIAISAANHFHQNQSQADYIINTWEDFHDNLFQRFIQ